MRAYIRSKQSRSTTVFYFGESRSHKHGLHDRVVKVTNSSVINRMNMVDADVYLIDASGSTAPYWNEIISYDYRSDSRVVLSKMSNCLDGQSISSVIPGGGTEIWYSYWFTIQSMKPGETLAIISDFDSNVQLSWSEHLRIDNLVREKRIRVVAIQY